MVRYRDHETPEAFFYTGENYGELWDFAREFMFYMNNMAYLKSLMGSHRR
jgi:hypothetical protein